MWLFPPFRLEPLDQRLWRGEERVSIKPKALAVLSYLVERPDRLVTKQELLAALWPDVHVDPGVVKTHVNEIRQVLDDRAKAPRFIETVPGYGYRFVGSIQQSPLAATVDSRGQGSKCRGDVLVGREHERACLERALGRALQGERQLVFVTGEAGIGKTMLVDRFLAPQKNNPAVVVGWGQCIEQYGAGEAYLPILEALSRIARRRENETLMKVLQRNAPTWVVQMPELLDAPSLPALERATAGVTRERMLRELAQALPLLAALRPLILVLEDLHWADPSTLTLISYLARQSDPARLLILGTFRPQEISLTPHPLWEIEQSLAAQQRCEAVALRHLDEAEIASFLDARFSPHRLPAELARSLCLHTSGNPLFLARVVDAMVKRSLLRQTNGCWQLDGGIQAAIRDVPPSITTLIQREVLRLTDFERSVLEAASVAGQEFEVSAVAGALEVDLVGVEELCARWSRTGRFVRQQESGEAVEGMPGLRCQFIHSLYQQVIGAGIPPARRARFHARIGAWLEAASGGNRPPSAAELSMHFERAAESARAISYRQLAGEQALKRCAYQEAIHHLQAAQELMRGLPEGPGRKRLELALLLALGIPVAMTRGYTSPEVERVYVQARDLCRDLGDVQRLLRVVIGLSVCYAVRGMFARAHELAEHADQLAQTEPDPAIHQEVNLLRLFSSFHLGELVKVRELMASAIERYGTAQTGSVAFSILQHLPTTTSFVVASPLWVLGYPDQARHWAENALALATERGDQFAMSQSLAYVMIVYIARGDREQLRARAEACEKLCAEHGFPFFHTTATMVLGFLRVEDGDATAGITLMRKAWQAREAAGMIVNAGFWYGLTAKAYAHAGAFDQALATLDEAFKVVRSRGDRWWEPELHRLVGDFSLRASATHQPCQDDRASEVAYSRALELARNRGAKSLELRAATSLARLWRNQGKRDAARQLLAGIYGWFTEGYETVDQREARLELEKLGNELSGMPAAAASL
jgi:predicted ATPase/DNA-binding winged helix-turn-helix (wHTH) protein